MIKLSILTAYYKTYSLTKELAKILIRQITDEVEWIIVDDGCNEFRLDKYQRYKNVKVIHLDKNYGGAYAYNKAIDNAKGNYIAFIDCDDSISKIYVSTLINAINNHTEDLIFMDWQDKNTNITYRHPTNIAGWKCIYKKSILPRFNEENKTAFDVSLHNEIIKDKYSKYYLNEILYYYNSNRVGSITETLKRSKYGK